MIFDLYRATSLSEPTRKKKRVRTKSMMPENSATITTGGWSLREFKCGGRLPPYLERPPAIPRCYTPSTSYALLGTHPCVPRCTPRGPCRREHRGLDSSKNDVAPDPKGDGPESQLAGNSDRGADIVGIVAHINSDRNREDPARHLDIAAEHRLGDYCDGFSRPLRRPTVFFSFNRFILFL